MGEAKGAALVALPKVKGGTDNMNHLTEKQFSAYTNRTLSASELLWVDDHLNECAACRENLSSVLQAWGGDKAVNAVAWELAADVGEDHLVYAQLAAYVDERLDEVEREIVLGHLHICQICREEINDLQAFKQTLFTPTLATSVMVTATKVTPASYWEHILFALRTARWWVIPATVTASLALLALWFFRRQTATPIVVQRSGSSAVAASPPSISTNSSSPDD